MADTFISREQIYGLRAGAGTYQSEGTGLYYKLDGKISCSWDTNEERPLLSVIMLRGGRNDWNKCKGAQKNIRKNRIKLINHMEEVKKYDVEAIIAANEAIVAATKTPSTTAISTAANPPSSTNNFTTTGGDKENVAPSNTTGTAIANAIEELKLKDMQLQVEQRQRQVEQRQRQVEQQQQDKETKEFLQGLIQGNSSTMKLVIEQTKKYGVELDEHGDAINALEGTTNDMKKSATELKMKVRKLEKDKRELEKTVITMATRITKIAKDMEKIKRAVNHGLDFAGDSNPLREDAATSETH